VTVDAEVFIIGAGPAGLTAAYCLTKETPSVIVIEKDPTYVGGIARTIQYKDFLFDIGGQRFASAAREVVDFWHEILPGELVARPQLSRIFCNGKYYPYPLTASETLKNLGVFASAACMMSYALARAKPIAQPRSFHDWGRNQFGEKLFRTFFKTYTEKVWGMSCDDISADWAAQRIKGFDLSVVARHVLHRSLRGKRKQAATGETVNAGIDTFHYPRKGPGMMWDAAARKIRERGGQVLMGRELRRLTYEATANLWRIEVATPSAVETYTARHVISSAPVRDLVDCLATRPISHFQARALRYRDLITVALMAKRPKPFPDNSIYVHEPSIKVGRVQNFNALSPDMAPEGMSCLGLEYFCFEGDGLWNASDEELIALARNEISHIGLFAADDIIDGCVVRQPKAYPICDEDYRHNMAMIRLDFETHYPTLHLVGRNGMHKYHNQDHAMMTAMMTAKNILAGEKTHDVWNVNENSEYPEAGGGGFPSASSNESPEARKLAREVAA
jgi:protoporphyrinogen oxidase